MDNYTQITKSISLKKYGIDNAGEIVYNPSYDLLFQEELNPQLEGFEKGQLSELGAELVGGIVAALAVLLAERDEHAEEECPLCVACPVAGLLLLQDCPVPDWCRRDPAPAC